MKNNNKLEPSLNTSLIHIKKVTKVIFDCENFKRQISAVEKIEKAFFQHQP